MAAQRGTGPLFLTVSVWPILPRSRLASFTARLPVTLGTDAVAASAAKSGFALTVVEGNLQASEVGRSAACGPANHESGPQHEASDAPCHERNHLQLRLRVRAGADCETLVLMPVMRVARALPRASRLWSPVT